MRANEKMDWIYELDNLPREEYSIPVSHWQELYHLIVVPTYNESAEILRETLSALRDSDYPKGKMIVVLAVEEQAGKETQKRAKILQQEFD